MGALACPNLPVVAAEPEGLKGVLQSAVKGQGAIQVFVSISLFWIDIDTVYSVHWQRPPIFLLLTPSMFTKYPRLRRVPSWKVSKLPTVPIRFRARLLRDSASQSHPSDMTLKPSMLRLHGVMLRFISVYHGLWHMRKRFGFVGCQFERIELTVL